ncbi:MAG: B12-binding domain-containing radical SAM protein [Candidatus Sericytochromatia bacterium]|nr:B12-binding domain-containing radical SAM protein [Candidatus Sericytochromatia bacterium]
MKVGLLNIRPKYEDYSVPISLPSSCDYLASYLNTNMEGCEAHVEYELDDMLAKKPDIIGLSSFTRTYTAAREIAKEIKKRTNIPVIIGGHHISALPYNLDHTMDIGVLGEGEITLIEILRLYELGNVTDQKLAEIDGIVYYNENKELIRTKPRALIKDLDSLPIPYRTPFKKSVVGHLQHAIFTSRGCPFRCKYCAISEFWDQIRYHSPERVLEELMLLISQTNCREIAIYDDLFGINKKRLKSLVDLIRSENIHKKVNFTCNARASVFDDEICQLFLDMNIKACVFGMESANDRILAYMKGSTTGKQNQKALDLCKKYNISATPNFIIGFPTETPAEASESYWFIRKNKELVNDFRVFPACPLPGTHLWDYAIEKKIVQRDYEDWDEVDFFFTPEKSIYLNAEIYDQYEYKSILDSFYELRNKSKNFNVTSGEKYEKYVYSEKLLRYISLTLSLKNKPEVLEITNLNFSVNNNPQNTNVKTISLEKYTKLDLSDYQENSFDNILLFHVLEFFPEPEKEILKLKKLLKPNGKIVLVTYNVKNPLFFLTLIKGLDTNNAWSAKERELINQYVEMAHAKEDVENKFEYVKKMFNQNIYSYWGICSKNNVSHFEINRIKDIANKTELKILDNKKFFIDLDKATTDFYDQLSILISTSIGINNTKDYSFSNVSFLTSA